MCVLACVFVLGVFIHIFKHTLLYPHSHPYTLTLTDTLTLYLVDTVSGAVIESVNHKKVSGPIHVVHSENWVVYTFFNDKYRRFEVRLWCH